MSDAPNHTIAVHTIHGFLSVDEGELLYRLASGVPANGNIIEIGSYQGRSTVCLGLGAKQAGAWVYAIDPHDDYQVNDTTHYGMENHAILLKNLVEQGVADVVRVVAMRSMTVCTQWGEGNPIRLLWIDGAHDYSSVHFDLKYWAEKVSVVGKIAVHDSSGHFPGVTRALTEFLMEGTWKIVERIDATTVLERIDGS
jgi:predicted O-methyltransferase YrrM